MIKLIEPEATYLLWLDCRDLDLSGEELQALFREKGRIYFDEGYIFGPAGEGYERFNIACPNAMVVDVFERMEKAIGTLS